MTPFKDNDDTLIDRIVNGLVDRHRYNTANHFIVGTTSPEFDYINPSVVITPKEIKDLTKRGTMRRVVVDDYERKLKAFEGLKIERVADTLHVSVVPQRSREVDHPSLSDLFHKNEADAARTGQQQEANAETLLQA